jgi:putative bacteriocin precursor
MAKIGKKRSNPNSVEAYACNCACACGCPCSCNPICPIGGGGVTSSELTNQVFTNPHNYYFQDNGASLGVSNFTLVAI